MESIDQGSYAGEQVEDVKIPRFDHNKPHHHLHHQQHQSRTDPHHAEPAPNCKALLPPRGYGSAPTDPTFEDEAEELRQRLPLPGIETITGSGCGGGGAGAGSDGNNCGGGNSGNGGPVINYGTLGSTPHNPLLENLQPIRTEEIIRLRNDGGGVTIVETPPGHFGPPGRMLHWLYRSLDCQKTDIWLALRRNICTTDLGIVGTEV